MLKLMSCVAAMLVVHGYHSGIHEASNGMCGGKPGTSGGEGEGGGGVGGGGDGEGGGGDGVGGGGVGGGGEGGGNGGGWLGEGKQTHRNSALAHSAGDVGTDCTNMTEPFRMTIWPVLGCARSVWKMRQWPLARLASATLAGLNIAPD